MPNIFVEEYRKELSLTGYPFSAYAPLLTDTGYSFAMGTIEDASIYCETASKVPVFSAIEKEGERVALIVGDYTATLSLSDIPEVLSLYTERGVFGGILVLNTKRARFLDSWKEGKHMITHPLSFCPRCLEMVPPIGVQRLMTDSGEIMSGDIVISGGEGTTLQLLVSESGIVHLETNFVGDPTYTANWPEVPIQQIVCTDTLGTVITLTGDESRNVSLVASGIYMLVDPKFSEYGVFDDVLRVEGFGNTVHVSLGGK